MPTAARASSPRPAGQPLSSAYADIEDIFERLDDLARERNWEFSKRLDIARLERASRRVDRLPLIRWFQPAVYLRRAQANLRTH